MERDRVAELAAEHGFADIGASLAELALPSIRMHAVGGTASLGATRLGGLPDLPPTVAWPADVASGMPMAFVAQVSLVDISPTVWTGQCSGVLSFFYHPDPATRNAMGPARVLEIPPGRELVPRPAPEALEDDFVLRPTAVAVVKELTLPTIGVWPAEALRRLGFSEEGSWGAIPESAYDELLRRLAREQHDGAQVCSGHIEHRLLGWPRHIQGDVLPELVLSHFDDIGYAYEDGDLERHATEWRLLLQVGDDDRLATTFGDVGGLYFGLPWDDLAVGRFDSVRAVSQSA
jgi:hypothetical protein